MRIDIISLFPDMLEALRKGGVVANAIKEGVLSLEVWNPRTYASGTHLAVDDRPYGGGPGMVMMPDPTVKALRDAKAKHRGKFASIYMSPQGQVLTQKIVNQLAQYDGLVILSGRYEGVDERVIDLEIDHEYSLGDYVVSGGELPAMILVDAVARQCDNVLGDNNSAEQDSFMDGLLDWPHYTRPAEFEGLGIPAVLSSGDHNKIKSWRLKQSLGRTFERRPDLITQKELNDEEQLLLEEYIKEHSKEVTL